MSSKTEPQYHDEPRPQGRDLRWYDWIHHQGRSTLDYHKDGLRIWKARVKELEELIDRIKAWPANSPLRAQFGSPLYIIVNQLRPALRIRHWHQRCIDKIMAKRRRLQQRKARQAYESRHPERRDRFLNLPPNRPYRERKGRAKKRP